MGRNFKMVTQKKQKKAVESINSRLALVMKSGKYTLGYRKTLETLRQGKAKLNIMLCWLRQEFIIALETTLNLERPVVNISVSARFRLQTQETLTSFGPCRKKRHNSSFLTMYIKFPP